MARGGGAGEDDSVAVPPPDDFEVYEAQTDGSGSRPTWNLREEVNAWVSAESDAWGYEDEGNQENLDPGSNLAGSSGASAPSFDSSLALSKASAGSGSGSSVQPPSKASGGAAMVDTKHSVTRPGREAGPVVEPKGQGREQGQPQLLFETACGLKVNTGQAGGISGAGAGQENTLGLMDLDLDREPVSDLDPAPASDPFPVLDMELDWGTPTTATPASTSGHSATAASTPTKSSAPTPGAARPGLDAVSAAAMEGEYVAHTCGSAVGATASPPLTGACRAYTPSVEPDVDTDASPLAASPTGSAAGGPPSVPSPSPSLSPGPDASPDEPGSTFGDTPGASQLLCDKGVSSSGILTTPPSQALPPSHRPGQSVGLMQPGWPIESAHLSMMRQGMLRSGASDIPSSILDQYQHSPVSSPSASTYPIPTRLDFEYFERIGAGMATGLQAGAEEGGMSAGAEAGTPRGPGSMGSGSMGVQGEPGARVASPEDVSRGRCVRGPLWHGSSRTSKTSHQSCHPPLLSPVMTCLPRPLPPASQPVMACLPPPLPPTSQPVVCPYTLQGLQLFGRLVRACVGTCLQNHWPATPS